VHQVPIGLQKLFLIVYNGYLAVEDFSHLASLLRAFCYGKPQGGVMEPCGLGCQVSLGVIILDVISPVHIVGAGSIG
jgi:hypothetical protein